MLGLNRYLPESSVQAEGEFDTWHVISSKFRTIGEFAWLVVETNSKDEARYIVPPAFRADASITELNNFTMEQLDRIQHKG